MRTVALAVTFFILRGMAALWRGEDAFAHYLPNLLSLERAAALSERDMFSLIFVLCVHFLFPFKKIFLLFCIFSGRSIVFSAGDFSESSQLFSLEAGNWYAQLRAAAVEGGQD